MTWTSLTGGVNEHARLRHHPRVTSGFDKLRPGGLDLSPYKDERGFELIAQELGIAYPSRAAEEPR